MTAATATATATVRSSLHRWSTLIALSSCALLVTTPHLSSAQPVTNIIWREEFDGETLDTNVWSYESGNGQGGWGNGELQDYQQTNVGVADGSLSIVASKQEPTEAGGSPTFTSGRIKTEGKVAIKYGTIAARIKVPDVNAGLWPGFWTIGQNFATVGWPAAGEIDIMEVGQGTAVEAGVVNRRVVSAAHWQHNGTYATYADQVDTTYDLNNTWVVYYLDWTPLALKTYVGSNQVWEMNIDSATCSDCQELHQPHFLILSMAVGGGFTGGSGSSSAGGSSCASSSSAGSSSSGGCGGLTPEQITAPLPANMQVDWVRVYNNSYTEYYGPPPAPTIPPGGEVAEPVPVPVPTPAPVPLPDVQTPTTPAPVPLPDIQTPTTPAPVPLPDIQTPTAPAPVPFTDIQPTLGDGSTPITPTTDGGLIPVIPTIPIVPTQEEPIVPATPTIDTTFPGEGETPDVGTTDSTDTTTEVGYSSYRSKNGGGKSGKSGHGGLKSLSADSQSFGGKSGKSGGKSSHSASLDAQSIGGKKLKKSKHSSSYDESYSTSQSVLQAESSAKRLQPPQTTSTTTSFLVAGIIAVTTSLLFALL